jgi:hypothetical protein
MLAACRLACLSALEPYYEGVRGRAQCGPPRTPVAGPALHAHVWMGRTVPPTVLLVSEVELLHAEGVERF